MNTCFHKLQLWAWGGAFFVCCTDATMAQTLRQQVMEIAGTAHGKVSVACALPGSSLECAVDSRSHPPMQSVFKLPLAMTILHQVEEGKYNLGQPIRFRPEDRFTPRAYSPLQDEFPDANVDVPLRELLRRAVTESDNVAADMLLRLAGGPEVVDEFVAALGVEGFHLVDTEHAMHVDESLQYRNWFEPEGAVQLLRRLSDRSPLTADHTKLLLDWMRHATIVSRLQAGLPDGILVAHKSGSSGVEKGMAAATNDIGLILLPDGRELAVAVFVTNSKADAAMRDRVIARVGRAIYDAALLPSSTRR